MLPVYYCIAVESRDIVIPTNSACDFIALRNTFLIEDSDNTPNPISLRLCMYFCPIKFPQSNRLRFNVWSCMTLLKILKQYPNRSIIQSVRNVYVYLKFISLKLKEATHATCLLKNLIRVCVGVLYDIRRKPFWCDIISFRYSMLSYDMRNLYIYVEDSCFKRLQSQQRFILGNVNI